VADIRVISGRATAEESKRDVQTGKESQRPRTVSLIVSWCLMAAGLLIALAPLADAATLPEEIAALQAQVAALQSAVSALQGQVNTQQGKITTLQGQIATLQINPVIALGPFVSVDPNPENGVIGPHITFKGANIHIISGVGTTNDNGNPSGLGNLIIGYDESPDAVIPGTPALSPGDRGGSHNLIIGRGNRFTQLAFGGLVAGELNTVSAEGTTVSGGFNNTASGAAASVSGGFNNTASGVEASVSGGFNNTASNNQAGVSGGANNTASGAAASVSGGFNNTASGVEASVSGGANNTASSNQASVSGGFTNTASNNQASVSGGSHNTASGQVASVSGGANNTAGGSNTVVIGGTGVTDNNNFSIAPQPPFPRVLFSRFVRR
jgi:trimeric autotransporter adhesin